MQTFSIEEFQKIDGSHFSKPLPPFYECVLDQVEVLDLQKIIGIVYGEPLQEIPMVCESLGVLN